jgi:hypothetical protein
MTDTTPGGFADTPGPDATPEQDADVRALLAALRDADVPMPDDVWTRLAAVIAEEQRTALASGAPAAAAAPDDDAVVPGLAPVTVLPTAEERAARPSRSALRWVLGAAAAFVVVGGAYGVMHGITGSTGISTSAGAASTAPEAASDAGTVVTTSGTAYTTSGLQSQARALVASTVGRSAAFGQKDQSTPVPPAATQVPGTATQPLPTASPSDVGAPATRSGATLTAERLAALMPRDAALTRCIDELSGVPGTRPVAIDVGTFNGKPALVVVLPSTDDPASLDVIVVPVNCTSSDFAQLVRVPRP